MNLKKFHDSSMDGCFLMFAEDTGLSYKAVLNLIQQKAASYVPAIIRAQSKEDGKKYMGTLEQAVVQGADTRALLAKANRIIPEDVRMSIINSYKRSQDES